MSLTFGKESEMPPEEKLKAAAGKAAQEEAAAKSISHTLGCEPLVIAITGGGVFPGQR